MRRFLRWLLGNAPIGTCPQFSEIIPDLKRMDFHLWKLRRDIPIEFTKTKELIMAVSQEIQDLQAQVAALQASDAASAQSVTDAFARLEAKIAGGQSLSQEDKDALAAAKAAVAALGAAEVTQKAQADAEAPPAP